MATWLLALLASGCADDKKVPPPAPVRREIVNTGPIEQLAAPPDVLVFGGADDPAAALTQLDNMMGAMAGGAAKPEMAATALARNFGLTGATAIDMSRPLRFVLFDQKKVAQPLCLSIGTKTKVAFIATLPSSKETTTANSFRFSLGRDRKVHVNFIDDVAVLCHDPKVFGQHRAFFTKLLGATIQSRVGVVLAMENIAVRYRASLAALGQKWARMQPAHSPASPALATAFEGLTSLMVDLDRLLIRLNEAPRQKAGAGKAAPGKAAPLEASQLGMVMKLIATPKKGSTLAKALAGFSAGELGILQQLPPDTAFALALTVDNSKPHPITAKLLDLTLGMSLGSALAPSDSSAQKHARQVREYFRATTGQVVLAAHPLDGELSVAVVTGLRDAKAAKKTWGQLLESYDDPAVQKRHAELGVAIALTKKAYDVNGTPVATIATKFAGQAKALPHAPAMTRDLLQGMMQTHMALTDSMQITTIGRHAGKAMKAWLEGKVAGGLARVPGVQRARRNAISNPFMLLYGSPITVARMLRVGGQKPFAAALPNEPAPKTGVALSAGVVNGQPSLVVDVSAEQARTLIQLMTMSQGLR